MAKLKEFLKAQWWLLLILIGILILVLIPAQDGMPDSDYRGCSTEESVCQYSTIKSITKESDGSAVLTVPVEISENETRDTNFYLNEYREKWQVGNKIFMNFSPSDNKTYLFIGYRSNLFMTLLWNVLNASQGSSAIVEFDTGKEIEKTSNNSSQREAEPQKYYESRGSSCTSDCSGHDAGYEWAEENSVCDASYADGKSESFDEGVRVYAEENC